MLVPALLVAFAYWITWLIDGILGWQTMTRPIVLGTVIGLLCGDLKTGVITVSYTHLTLPTTERV